MNQRPQIQASPVFKWSRGEGLYNPGSALPAVGINVPLLGWIPNYQKIKNKKTE